MDHLTNSLNYFFDNNNGIVIDQRYNLRFSTVWGPGNRLKSIVYNYIDQTDGSITQFGVIVDMYIYGNVALGVTYTDPNGVVFQVPNDEHWGSKNIRDTTNTDYIQRLPPLNGLLPKNFLFFNKIDIVVRDGMSNMSYIAPGDLLNDTLRMIYQSIYNINIQPNNNKLIKYLKKYSKLVKTLNNIYTICPHNSCLNISPMTILRNTNILDCNNGIINNMTAFTDSIYNSLEAGGFLNNTNLAPYKTNITSSKLCEILRVLNNIPSIARQNSQ
jgi:alpha-glucuronidase